jgi:hypothetical protein
LTGFNHYPDCECGWCVNYGRMSRANRARLLDDLRHRDTSSTMMSVICGIMAQTPQA